MRGTNFPKPSELSGGLDWPSLPGNAQEHVFDIDNFLDAFMQVNCEGIVTAWNLQAQETFGWSCAEAQGHLASELMIPIRNRDRFQQGLRLIFGQAAVQRSRMKITAQHRNGTEFEAESVFFPMPSGEGIGIFTRPIEQRMVTKTEAEKQYQALMDQLGECYSEADLRGNITFVNKAYCDAFGISRERREGYNYKTVFAPEMARLFRETYGKVLRTGEPAKIDYSLMLHNGKQAFNEQSVSLKRDAQGNAVGFMIIVRDCFERKQNESDLLQAKQAAETASRAKGEFLANMSHEIRTPLNGVIGALELMADIDPAPAQRDLIKMAQSAAGSLLAVINDVLDFSKIEAGKLELDRVELDPAEVVRQAADIVTPAAIKKGLELKCEIAPEVPHTLLGDAIRLKQILFNLVGNAVKFTPEGCVKVQVQAEGISENRVTLKFSIADTGIGIPPEKQGTIFEPFSQVDASTTRKFGGTGLGLAICSRIIQAMGGRIWVESEIGKGSTFHFTAVVDLSAEAGQKREKLVHAPSREMNQNLRILLVEDNLVNQKLAGRMLEKLGHHVVVAGSGTEALSKLQDQAFDLVFMDVQMPEMDGLAATAAIRTGKDERSRRIPIVAMTAHAMNGDRERCIASGMNDYISKPVSTGAIKNAIHRVVKSR